MNDEKYHYDEENHAQTDDGQIADLSLSLSKKERERQALQAQMEAFLSHGGTISHVEPNVLADPPKKPQSNYGGQPI